jgi:tetratricopeptide (TPR) repeat protein
MPEKFCPNCGKETEASAKYCSNCGQDLSAKTGPKVRGGKLDNLIIIGVIALTVLIYVVYQVVTSHSEPETQAGRPPVDSHPPEVNMQAFLENLPEEHGALVGMGNELMDRGQYQLAIECYSRALSQKPVDPHVRVDMGACYHALGDNERAIQEFKTALEHNPEHEVAKFNLGIVYSLLGDREQAAQWWRKLLAQDPPADLKQRTQELLNELESGGSP